MLPGCCTEELLLEADTLTGEVSSVFLRLGGDRESLNDLELVLNPDICC